MILNLITIAIVVAIVMLLAGLTKLRLREPDVSATDAVQPLITGDRLKEVWNVNVIDLMSGPEGTFLPSDAQTTLEFSALESLDS